jgi:hypothetical protein
MNGKDLPSDSREMEALIAYIKFVGKGTPEGVRVAGMGLKSIKPPEQPPDSRRGQEVYAKLCANCHKEDGQGEQPGRHRLFNSAAMGRCELQCWCRHGQDRLCRVLHPRQHAVRHHVPDADVERATGLGRGGLYHLEAAPSGDVGDRL